MISPLKLFRTIVLLNLNRKEKALLLIAISVSALLDALIIIVISHGRGMNVFDPSNIWLALLIPVYYFLRVSSIRYANNFTLLAGHRFTSETLDIVLKQNFNICSQISIATAASTFTQISRNAIHGCVLQSVNAVNGAFSFLIISIFLTFAFPKITLLCLLAILIPGWFYSFYSKRKSILNSSKIVVLFEEETRLITNFWKSFKYNFIEGNQQELLANFIKTDKNLRMLESSNLTLSTSYKYILEFFAVLALASVYIAIKGNSQLADPTISLLGPLFGLYRILPSAQQYLSCASLISSHSSEFMRLISIRESKQFIGFENKLDFSLTNHSRESNTNLGTYDNCVLSIENVKLPYTNKLLSNVRIINGNIIGITGESGAGKSVLLDILYGLYPPTDGALSLLGYNIQEIQNEICYLPQLTIPPQQKIREFLGINDKNLPLVRSLLSDLNLNQMLDDENYFDNNIGQSEEILSGGQISRIILVRFLLRYFSKKRIFILDEFTSGNDSSNRDLMLNLLIRMTCKPGNLLIYTSHHPEDFNFADKVISI